MNIYVEFSPVKINEIFLSNNNWKDNCNEPEEISNIIQIDILNRFQNILFILSSSFPFFFFFFL